MIKSIFILNVRYICLQSQLYIAIQNDFLSGFFLINQAKDLGKLEFSSMLLLRVVFMLKSALIVISIFYWFLFELNIFYNNLCLRKT